MRKQILDVSDCSESPLLGRSKLIRRAGRRSSTDLFFVRYQELRSRSHPKIDGLNEAFFAGISNTLSVRVRVKSQQQF